MSVLDHRLEPAGGVRRFEVINGANGRRRWTTDSLPEAIVDEARSANAAQDRIEQEARERAERLAREEREREAREEYARQEQAAREARAVQLKDAFEKLRRGWKVFLEGNYRELSPEDRATIDVMRADMKALAGRIKAALKDPAGLDDGEAALKALDDFVWRAKRVGEPPPIYYSPSMGM